MYILYILYDKLTLFSRSLSLARSLSLGMYSIMMSLYILNATGVETDQLPQTVVTGLALHC